MTPQQRSAAAKKAYRSRKRQDEALASPVEPAPEKPKSKSARIIDLLATTDLTRAEIAARIGCLPEYVRVVEQRLAAEPGNRPEERWQKRNKVAYLARMRERYADRYANDPEFRERRQRYNREQARRRWNDPDQRQKLLDYQRDRRRRLAEARA